MRKAIAGTALGLLFGVAAFAGGVYAQRAETPTETITVPPDVLCQEEDSCHLDFHDSQWWARPCPEDDPRSANCTEPWTPLTRKP